LSQSQNMIRNSSRQVGPPPLLPINTKNSNIFFSFLSRNKLSYPLCHGILIASLFLVNLISLYFGSGLFFMIGLDSEEYKKASFFYKILGCRWKSFGVDISTTLSVIAILVSFIPFIVSTVLVKNSSDGCKPAFNVKRYQLNLIPIADEDMEEVRRISFIVKISYICTGIPLALLYICASCSNSVVFSILGITGAIISGVLSRGGISLKLPDYTSRLNEVLSPPGKNWYYLGLLWGCIGHGALGYIPFMSIYGVLVWLLTNTLDL